MKITKLQWDLFWATLNKGEGGLDWYYDDSDAPEDVDEMPKGEVFSITGGVLHYQGPPTATAVEVPGIFTRKQVQSAIGGETLSMVPAIKRFLAAQTEAIVIVKVPIGNLELLRETVKTMGGEIVT